MRAPHTIFDRSMTATPPLDPKKRITALLVALSLPWLLVSTAADAGTILYRFEGQGYGLLGSQAFGGPFTIELLGDTGQIVDTSSSSQIGRSLTGPSTIELSDVGSANFTASMNIFISESRFFDVSDVGMGVTLPDGSGKAIFEVTSTDLFGYRLDSDFGPFFATRANLISQFNGVPTDLGDLEFSSMFNITFTATTVPEPSSLSYVAIGLGFLGRYRRLLRNRFTEGLSGSAIDELESQ